MTMFPINQFTIKTISENETEGVFQIGPLPKGYGSTIGNTYRRLLMTSIPGAAITQISIAGVQHEYTTLAGMEDDVLSLILALKGLSVISYSDDPVELRLKVKGEKGGPRLVTAADIEKNSMIEIVNEDYPLTTLADEKASVDAVVTVEKGLGYAMQDDEARRAVGVIPVDAIFTPVRLVSVNVSNTRVGQQTDLDQLELRLTTNGAITPSAALVTAADIFQKVGEHLLDSARNLLDERSTKLSENVALPVSDGLAVSALAQNPIYVSDLNLSTRLTNALLNGGYEDLRSLEGMPEEDVASIKGMGEKSFAELKEILAENGINLT